MRRCIQFRMHPDKFSEGSHDSVAISATVPTVLKFLKNQLAKRGYTVTAQKTSGVRGFLVLRQEIRFQVVLVPCADSDVFWVTHDITDELRWSFKRFAWLDFNVIGSDMMEEIEDILRYSDQTKILSVVREFPQELLD